MFMRKPVRIFLLLTVLLALMPALAACSKSESTSATDQNSASSASSGSGGTTGQSSSSGLSPANPQEGTLYTPKYQLNGQETAVIKTNKGTIKVKFFEQDAPIAVANFIELSLKGFYDGIKFHRYVPGFVIQGGDPQTKSATSADVANADASQSGQFGTGGPGYTIKDEYANNPNLHVDGSLAMARTQAPNSSGSQFYFALGTLQQLDHQYTVFGQTTSGLDVVHNLRAGDVIESITIEHASK